MERSRAAWSVSFVLRLVLAWTVCLAPHSVSAQLEPAPEPSTSEGQTASSQPRGDHDSESILIKSALVKLLDSYEIPAEQGGIVEEIFVTEGQMVQQNELVCRLRGNERILELERAQLEYQITELSAASDIDIEYAKKSFQVAAAELSRSESANRRVENSIPVSRIEKQRLEKDRTALQLKQAYQSAEVLALKARQAANRVQLAELELSKTGIRSPIGGMVIAVGPRVGEWVEPAQTLARVVQVDRLKLEGFVTAEKSRQLTIGMPVTVQFPQAWIGEPVQGHVTFVNPEANPVNLNLQVWVEVSNPDGALIPGMRGDISIRVEPTQ